MLDNNLKGLGRQEGIIIIQDALAWAPGNISSLAHSLQAFSLLHRTAALLLQATSTAPDRVGLPGHAGCAMTQSSWPAVPLGWPGHQGMSVAVPLACCQPPPLRTMLVHMGALCCQARETSKESASLANSSDYWLV